MCDEVVCLSSDENDSDSASTKNSKMEKMEDDEETKKRKLSSLDTGPNKKQKLDKCCSPQPGCSKDFNKVEKVKKKFIKPQLVVKEKVTIPDVNEDVFQNFVKTCLAKRDNKDARKVLEKLEKSYNKLSPLEQNNDDLRLFVSSCQERITKGLANDIYTPILDLHTEIKSRIKARDNTEDDNVQEIEVSEEDMKKIKLLKKSIDKCLKKIKELEEKEVDFAQDNDSAYIQEDKYKKRFIQLCNMLSQVSGDKDIRKQILKKKIRRKDIPDEMTGISSVDDAILSSVNSDIGKINQLKYLKTECCADYIKMPEYLDILNCIEQCDQKSNLGLSKEKKNKLAKRAFKAVGNFLKQKRMGETNFYMQSLLDGKSEDPAKKDVDLDKKLQENKEKGDMKLEGIFKKYVDLQENGEDKDESETDEDEDLDTDSFEEGSSDEKLESTINSEQVIDHNDTSNISEEKLSVATNALESSDSEHRIVNEDCANLVNEDDDVLVNDALDDNIEATDPLDIDNDVKMTNAPVCQSENAVSQPGNAVFQPENAGSQPENSVTQPGNSVSQPENNSSPTKEGSVSVSTADEVVEAKASFIKVCAFAKPPPAWGELSPEKVKTKLKSPMQQAQAPKPDYIDLTEEKETERRLPLRKSINPLANVKPAKNVVIVKNVINNYNGPIRVEKSGAVPPRSTSKTMWLTKDKTTATHKQYLKQ